MLPRAKHLTSWIARAPMCAPKLFSPPGGPSKPKRSRGLNDDVVKKQTKNKKNLLQALTTKVRHFFFFLNFPLFFFFSYFDLYFFPTLTVSSRTHPHTHTHSHSHTYSLTILSELPVMADGKAPENSMVPKRPMHHRRNFTGMNRLAGCFVCYYLEYFNRN